MSKYVVLILAVLSFTSCKDIYDVMADDYYYSNINKTDIYYNDSFHQTNSNIIISTCIISRIEYKKDNIDYWQTPEETWTLGTGDCEDIALLFINIKYVSSGEKYDIVLIDSETMEYNFRTIEDGGYINHAIVRDKNGQCFDPRNGLPVNCYVGFSYSFDSLFRVD